MEWFLRVLVYCKLITPTVNKVFDIIKRYENDMSFENIKDYEIVFLPQEYLKECVRPQHLMNVWLKLPKKYRNDVTLQRKLPCLEHYNLPNVKNHFDGPPPAVMDCLACRHHEAIAEY